MNLVFLLVFELTLAQTSVPLNSESAYKHSSSNEAVCKYNVSQAVSGSFHTVADAINQTCSETDGYEITLLDSEHIESLKISKKSAILIKGNNEIPTIWQLDSPHKELINLKQGYLTLENIEFRFVSLKLWYSMIQPSYQLIYVGNDSFSSLTLNQCTFQSISDKYGYIMYQILIDQVDRVQITDTHFIGIGTQEKSNITMIAVINFNEYVILQRCKFENISVNSLHEPVWLSAHQPKQQIIIQDCEFISIVCNNNNCKAALAIWDRNELVAEITGNKFTNCKTVVHGAGALYITDENEINAHSYYSIKNNTFGANHGIQSGAVYLSSKNPQFNYSFNNNRYISNKNTQKKGVGQDTYLNITNAPYDWSKDNITDIMEGFFNGSVSDAKKDSIHYEVYKNYLIRPELSGSITLPNKINNGERSKDIRRNEEQFQ